MISRRRCGEITTVDLELEGEQLAVELHGAVGPYGQHLGPVEVDEALRQGERHPQRVGRLPGAGRQGAERNGPPFAAMISR